MKNYYLFIAFLMFGFGFGQNPAVFTDPTFQSPKLAFNSSVANDGGFFSVKINSVCLLNDGKTLIAGLFNNFNGEPVSNLVRLNVDGSLDTSFIFSNEENNYGVIEKVIVQNDNKLLLLQKVNNLYQITRLMSDGSRDLAYNNSIFTELLFSGDSSRLKIMIEKQSNDKIIVMLSQGRELKINGIVTVGCERLNNDGTIDSTFNSPFSICYNYTSEIIDFKVAFDNKIIITGRYLYINSCLNSDPKNFIRLNENGLLDSSFSPVLSQSISDVTLLKICISNNNDVYVAGRLRSVINNQNVEQYKIIKINSIGTVDTSFADVVYSNLDTSNEWIKNMVIQSDNKLLVYLYNNTKINNLVAKNVVRINTNGSIDSSFDINFTIQTYFNVLKKVESNVLVVKPNGNIVVGGHFISNSITALGLVEPNTNGILNTNFNIGTGFGYNGFVNKIQQLSNGKIIIAGGFDTVNGIVRKSIARLNTDGSLDTTFDSALVLGNKAIVRTFAVQQDGKIIVSGDFFDVDVNIPNRNQKYICRLNENGSIDTTFLTGRGFGPIILNNFTQLPIFVSSIIIQTDGSVLLGGSFQTYQDALTTNIVRILSNGARDYYTSDIEQIRNGPVTKMEIQPDQKILVASSFSYNGQQYISKTFKRLNSNGTDDLSFNTAATTLPYLSSVKDFEICPDGKILIYYNSGNNHFIKKLNTDGTFDSSFVINLPQNRILDFCLQLDGKILVATNTAGNNTSLKSLSRFNIDGTLDNSFDVGNGFTKNSYEDFGCLRGASFDEFEHKAIGKSLFIQNDGKILVGGFFTNYNNEKANGTTRLLSVPTYDLIGQNKFDLNNNGCDSNDSIFSNLKFAISSGTNNFNYMSNNSGNYILSLISGNNTITPILENPSYFNVSPSLLNVNFPTQTSPQIQDFCITPNGTHSDLEVSLLPIDAARPGFNAKYKLVYKNKGNQLESGTINLAFNDSVLDLVSANPVVSSQSLNSFSWNFTNLNPSETREITIVLNLNTPMETPALNGGSILNYTATVASLQTDETPNNNTFALNQTVVNSFDPNDKTCLQGLNVGTSVIGDYVHYVIRFENTGNYAAQNITIKDVIDTNKFDVSTLIPLSGSALFTTKITDVNKVEFLFENINLPFLAATNTGYVAFKIKTKSTLTTGDTFGGLANIFFDYNFPITTNTYTTTIQALSSKIFSIDESVNVYPNPTSSLININANNNVKSIEVYDFQGRILQTILNANNLDLSDKTNGIYFLKITTEKGSKVEKIVKE